MSTHNIDFYKDLTKNILTIFIIRTLSVFLFQRLCQAEQVLEVIQA